MKRTFRDEERDCVFDLWKQGAGFGDIGRVIDAKPGSIFTILCEHGGIKPEKRIRVVCHLTIHSNISRHSKIGNTATDILAISVRQRSRSGHAPQYQ